MTTPVPETMRAVVSRFLRAPIVKILPVPTPTPSELLVKVSAGGMNPHDWKAMLFSFKGDIVGLEFSGTVVSAPPGSGFAPGDKVSGGIEHTPASGAYAEYLTVDPMLTWKREEGVSAHEGASVTVAWLTAALGVERRLVEWAGDRGLPEDGPILVYSANSCTGQYAVQYIKHYFPRRPILALASPTSHALLTQLGATLCLPYDLSASELKSALAEKDFNTPIQLAYNTYGLGDSTVKCEALMSSPGKIVSTLPRPKGGTNPAIEKEHVFAFTVFNRPIRLLWMSWPAIPEDHAIGVKRVKELAELFRPGGPIKPMATEEVGGLDGAVEGLQRLKSGKVRGKKLVVGVAEE